MDSYANGVLADMLFPASAVTAMATCKMTFSCNSFTDFQICYTGAHLFNISHVFMANCHRGLNGFLRQCIPFINMKIGTADRRFFDLDYDVIQTRFRYWNFLHP